MPIPERSLSLSDTAYRIIREKIIYGQLEQGAVISISAMAEELNISRTPVTLACQRLEYDKFLKVIPKQGVVICSISIDDARETYELRAAIETYCARRCFDTYNENDIEVLKNSLELQRAYVSDLDLLSFMKEDTKFHTYILGRYQRTQFSSVLDNLYDRAFMIGLKCSKSPERLKSTILEHESIINALEIKDKTAFVEAIERNILNGYVSLTSSLNIY